MWPSPQGLPGRPAPAAAGGAGVDPKSRPICPGAAGLALASSRASRASSSKRPCGTAISPVAHSAGLGLMQALLINSRKGPRVPNRKPSQLLTQTPTRLRTKRVWITGLIVAYPLRRRRFNCSDSDAPRSQEPAAPTARPAPAGWRPAGPAATQSGQRTPDRRKRS